MLVSGSFLGSVFVIFVNTWRVGVSGSYFLLGVYYVLVSILI